MTRSSASTADGGSDRSTAEHHIEIDGRRWRATDPEIPETFRGELVDELMAARRGVAAAHRSADGDAADEAHRRAHDAKVALGERGHPWWEPATVEDRVPRIRATIRTLTRHRAPDRSICPSDVARCVGGAVWRPLMDEVRDQASALAIEGAVHLTTRDVVLDPSAPLRGPIRIRDGAAEPTG